MKRHLHLVAIAAIAGSLAAGAVQSLFSAFAVQNELVPPTSGIFTGVQYSQKLGDAFRSLASCNKGATAPANVGGTAVDGLCWIDDSVSPWAVKQYVNGGWAVTGYLDPSSSTFAGVIGGGLGSIASASTTDLGSVRQASVTITGTTAITGFGSAAPAGTIKFIRFAGALKLMQSAALAVPGEYDLVTAAGDRAVALHVGGGNWEISQYTRANGIPVDVAAVAKIEYGTFESVPPNHVAGYGQALTRSSYPAYLAKVTRAQNGTRTSGNATITGMSNTSGFGAGMPVEGAGIGAGCTIATVASSTITLNSGACVTSSGTAPVTVFLTGYGAGGSSSTVGAPDCRARVVAGRDPVGTGRLTSTYFGGNAGIFGAVGQSNENSTLVTANLPPYTPSISVSVAASTVGYRFANVGTQGALVQVIDQLTFTGNSGTLNLGAPAVTVTPAAQGGASVPVRTVQPTLIAECVVRVTP